MSPHSYTGYQKDTSYIEPQGNFYWDTTFNQGIYCIAFKATEYLNGELLYYTMRDMLLYIVNEPVSVNDNQLANRTIHIFPNPTNSTLTIQTDVAWQDAIVTLTTPEGRVVLSQALINSQQQSLDISHLPNGMYFVTVQSAQQKWVKRLVKTD